MSYHLEFWDMHSIDEIPIHLNHVRTIQKSQITGSGNKWHTIRVIFSNGNDFNYRYENKEDRDKAFDELKRY